MTRPAVFLLALLLSLPACGTARRGEPYGEMHLTSEASRRGEEVFMHYCQACHPGGEAGLGPAINNKPLPGFLIRMQVRRGFGAMPPFPREILPDHDLDAVVAYLRDLRGQAKP
jgi:mono/diheme cytochrome c family protein